MYSEGQKKAKLGIVTIDIHGNSYRLRFIYPKGTRHQFTIAKVTPEGWVTAIKAAQLINRDIDLGDFDDTYVRYSPKHAARLEVAKAAQNKDYTLSEIWEGYKEVKIKTAAASTIKKDWSRLDRIIHSTPKALLSLGKAEEFTKRLLGTYAPGTLNPLLRLLYAAVNMHVKGKKIDSNPYLPFYSPYIKKQTKIECFETSEIKAIIAAFGANIYNPKSSPYCHSYYTPMIEFLALTGCRPSEAHALTWEDIKQRNGRTYVRFNKVWTSKVLVHSTKTHEIRLFPCNEQLVNLIERIPVRENSNNLVFPSVEGGYVTQGNFRKRYWKPVVDGLAKEGIVTKYLKPYCLRHSFITRLIRDGVDIATVASLSGNSPEIIIKNYLASRKDFDLPEL